jgi:hypothetical protein
MRIDQTESRPGLWAAELVAAVSVAAVSAAAPADPAPTPSPRVLKFLGNRAAEVLSRADRVEVFRVRAKRAGEKEKSVGGYVVSASGTEQGGPTARRLAGLLLDEKCYRFDHSTVGGFAPVVGLRLWEGDKSVEVLLSLATDEVVVFSHNPDDGSVRSAQADVLPARGALVAFVKAALPELDRDGTLE